MAIIQHGDLLYIILYIKRIKSAYFLLIVPSLLDTPVRRVLLYVIHTSTKENVLSYIDKVSGKKHQKVLRKPTFIQR